jgi:hypothetical protein
VVPPRPELVPALVLVQPFLQRWPEPPSASTAVLSLPELELTSVVPPRPELMPALVSVPQVKRLVPVLSQRGPELPGLPSAFAGA